MATLTETARVTRLIVKWGLIALAGLMVGRIALGAAVTWWKALHPPPPPPPTVGFGRLPTITFPDETQPEISYRLETVSGTTPDLGDRTPVYFMPIERPNLLALDRATEQAADLGFVFKPKQVSTTIYQWTKTQPLSSSLEVNIITGNFILEVNWRTDPTFLQKKDLPSETQAIAEAKSLLRNAKLLTDDLADGKTEVVYLKAVANQYSPTVSLSEADFVKVNFYRQLLGDNDLPVLTPKPENGVIQIIFSGSRQTGERIVSLIYNYFPVDYQNVHTYPLKSSQQAWQELQAGQGFIASIDENITQVTVRQLELAYFDSFEPQSYLQPIYVFHGDNNFIGYVSAIDPKWIQ